MERKDELLHDGNDVEDGDEDDVHEAGGRMVCHCRAANHSHPALHDGATDTGKEAVLSLSAFAKLGAKTFAALQRRNHSHPASRTSSSRPTDDELFVFG